MDTNGFVLVIWSCKTNMISVCGTCTVYRRDRYESKRKSSSLSSDIALDVAHARTYILHRPLGQHQCSSLGTLLSTLHSRLNSHSGHSTTSQEFRAIKHSLSFSSEFSVRKPRIASFTSYPKIHSFSLVLFFLSGKLSDLTDNPEGATEQLDWWSRCGRGNGEERNPHVRIISYNYIRSATTPPGLEIEIELP